jgi:hypothetical protein
LTTNRQGQDIQSRIAAQKSGDRHAARERGIISRVVKKLFISLTAL